MIQGADLYLLRAAALSSDDPLTAGVLLRLLGESPAEAEAVMRGSCWQEDLHDDPAVQRSQLRESLWSSVPSELLDAVTDTDGEAGGTR